MYTNSCGKEGCRTDDIYYLNYDASQAAVDDIPSRSSLEHAIVQWARDRMTARPANLYIILVDHGTADQFHVFPETVTANELGDWLDELQDNLNGQAADQEILVLLGFCRSGSFIDELSAAKPGHHCQCGCKRILI